MNNMPSLEVVEQKIDSHEAECLRFKTYMTGKIEKLEIEIQSIEKNKVSYQHFYWVIGILFTIVVSLLGYIVTVLHATRETTTLTQLDVSQIKGKLDPYEIKYEK